MKLRNVALVLCTASALVLSGCAAVGNMINGKPTSVSETGGKVEVTKTPEPKFAPKKVEPITATSPSAPVKDDGLGVEWRIMSVNQGSNGGAEFRIEMKNLNEEFAVPASAFGEPTLKNSGSTVSLMKTDGQGLDAPLGALSTTVITYTFNTSPWNLSNAEFTIGNAVFRGNLNL